MEVIQEVDKETIVEYIIDGLKEKKGQDIVCIDLTSVDNAVCSYFIICHGDSSTQVNGMAQWVEYVMEEKLDQKVWHKQGNENSQWVILDYVDVVVHVFQKEYRDFYNLEGLWADGKIRHYKNEYFK
jgi:iojap-like ribosome-associated protein